MKFTVLSHAGLLVESGGASVLIDPWLIGSCYWRSWFNFPEPEPELVRGITPTWIYLTHIHWDHFHGPSLRLFPRDTPILVPRTPNPRMARDLESMGFTDTREIPHGGTLMLAPGFELHSFQFRGDSAVVMRDAGTTLLNANDCKIFGLSLRQLTSRFPRVDFVLRSHSNASPIPYCVEDYEHARGVGKIRTKDDYVKEFDAFARAVRARYAIPFASNHCFVHRETRRFNETSVLPDSVAAYMNRHLSPSPASPRPDRPECVIMPSGSTWSDTEGFRLREFDYAGQAAYVEHLTRRHAETLAEQYRREEATIGDFPRFERYFRGFLDALSWPLRRMLPAVVFTVEEAGRKRYWLVNFCKRRVEEAAGDGDGRIVITVPALVLNDCVRKRMFTVWPPSKRLQIRLRNVGIARYVFMMLQLGRYTNGELSLRRLFSRRRILIRLRRWREPLSLAWALVEMKVTRRVRSVADLYTLSRRP